jgi:hypothetical protein
MGIVMGTRIVRIMRIKMDFLVALRPLGFYFLTTKAQRHYA